MASFVASGDRVDSEVEAPMVSTVHYLVDFVLVSFVASLVGPQMMLMYLDVDVKKGKPRCLEKWCISSSV